MGEKKTKCQLLTFWSRKNTRGGNTFYFYYITFFFTKSSFILNRLLLFISYELKCNDVYILQNTVELNVTQYFHVRPGEVNFQVSELRILTKFTHIEYFKADVLLCYHKLTRRMEEWHSSRHLKKNTSTAIKRYYLHQITSGNTDHKLVKF